MYTCFLKGSVFLTLVVILLACNSVDKEPAIVNPVPVVLAGDDQSVAAATRVTLSGSATDTDGEIVSYQWTQTSGTSVTISTSASAVASFTTPDNVEVMSFTLTATDDLGGNGVDSVDVTVTNIAPVADAGVDQIVAASQSVTLSGSGNDSDGTIATYTWLQTAGSTIVLSDPNAASTTFMSPSNDEILSFELTVTDNVGESHVDSLDVTVTNFDPTVNAGIDLTAASAEVVTLTGFASDSDGSIISYLWMQTAGTAVTLSEVGSATTTFVAPASEETLTFSLVVTDNIGATAIDDVSITISNTYEPGAVVTEQAYVRTDPAVFDTDTDCASFEPPYHPVSFRDQMTGPIFQIDGGPISVFWGGDYSALSASDADFLTQLQTDAALKINVANSLQEMRRLFVEKHKIDVSPTLSAVDGKCYRINIYMKGTGVYAGQTDPGGGGGANCDTGGEKEIPHIWVPYGNLIALANEGANQVWMIGHEYTHTVTCGVARGDQVGWTWFIESFANYIGNDIENITVALSQFHENIFWTIDTYFTRYGVWPFWMYLSNKFGYEFTGDVVQRESFSDESALEYLYRTMPFDCAVGDDVCRSEGFGNVFADFANSTVNYSLFTTMQGIDYRNAATSASVTQPRLSTHMHKVGANRYRVADWLAPQRYAYNIIELIPDPNDNTLTVGLTGWDVPARGLEWRATVVATLDDNAVPPVEAFGATFKSGTQTINLTEWEASLGTSIQRLHLVVVAVPTNWKKDNLLSAYDSPLRYRELDRYVYDVAISGAWPLGHEPETMRTAPSVAGAVHINGGGFVASTATVSATAYVGPEARVLDSAQVLNDARIEGRAIISGNAVVKDNAIVSSSVEMIQDSRAEGFATLRDNVLLRDSTSVIESGKLQGDASVWGTLSISGKGMSFGVPLTETTNSFSLTGTAMANGSRWLSSGTVSLGTSYDVWTVDDNNLFLAYDFSEPHPYRIKDTHLSSDAYYLNLEGRIGGSPDIQFDADLSSNVLVLNGAGYLEMPKWSFDQRSYQLAMRFKWQAALQTQYLLEVSSEKGDQLYLQIIPSTNNQFDVKLLFDDGSSASQELLLQDASMKAGRWMALELAYDDATAEMKLTVNPLNSEPIIEQAITLPSSTRAFHYDTLSVRLGSDLHGNAPFTGSLDEIKIYR